MSPARSSTPQQAATAPPPAPRRPMRPSDRAAGRGSARTGPRAGGAAVSPRQNGQLMTSSDVPRPAGCEPAAGSPPHHPDELPSEANRPVLLVVDPDPAD